MLNRPVSALTGMPSSLVADSMMTTLPDVIFNRSAILLAVMVSSGIETQSTQEEDVVFPERPTNFESREGKGVNDGANTTGFSPSKHEMRPLGGS